MDEPSTRERILDEIRRRLSAIDGAPPFTTRIGERIFLYEFPNFGPNDRDPATLISPQTDSVGHQQANLMIELPVWIGCVIQAADLNEVARTLEAGIADVKRAIELPDRKLGIDVVRPRIVRGSTTPYAREPGSTMVGLGITYTVPYVEGWGLP